MNRLHSRLPCQSLARQGPLCPNHGSRSSFYLMAFAFMNSSSTPGDWSRIIKQIGMFTFPGLNSEQVAFMTREYHIHMASDGRCDMETRNILEGCGAISHPKCHQMHGHIIS